MTIAHPSCRFSKQVACICPQLRKRSVGVHRVASYHLTFRTNTHE
ncbi:hypothetical protein [Mycobacterium lepromatosis]